MIQTNITNQISNIISNIQSILPETYNQMISAYCFACGVEAGICAISIFFIIYLMKKINKSIDENSFDDEINPCKILTWVIATFIAVIPVLSFIDGICGLIAAQLYPNAIILRLLVTKGG